MDEIKAKNALFLTEPSHIERAEQFLEAHPELAAEGYLLVPIGIETEERLRQKGTPFVSGRGLRPRTAEPLVLAEQWPARVLEDTQWSFFNYRGVSFARVYFFSLQTHLSAVLYYTTILSAACKAYPNLRQCVVFAQGGQAPVRGSNLLAQESAVFVSAACHAARELGKEVTVVGAAQTAPPAARAVRFALQRGLFSLGLFLLHAAVALVRRPKGVRILAYDYWRNLSPLLFALPQAEVLMIERLEAFAAGLKNIFRFRMRFVQLDSTAAASAACTQAQALFARRWEKLSESFDFSFATFNGISHAALLRDAFGVCVRNAIEHSLHDTDKAHALLQRTKPDIVLMRITTSSNQPRFPILAQAAKEQGIPAVEMQHGLDYNGDGTPSKFHNAEYLGLYGQLSIDELKAAGKDDYSTLIAIGSPRFDAYAAVHVSGEKKRGDTISVVAIAPSPCLPILLDTYDVEDYFVAVGDAARAIGGMQVVVKLRPGAEGQEYYRPIIAKAFKDVPHEVVHDEPMPKLLQRADIAVSCYSTAALEVLLSGVPLINLALSPAERMMGEYHFAQYAAAGAMEITHTQESFEAVLSVLVADPHKRAEARSAAGAFLKKNFLFDGGASKRVATIIETLAKK